MTFAHPLTLGSVTAPNSFVLAPVKTGYGTLAGTATARHVAYYARRAAGGAGLIVVEPAFVEPRGKEHPKQLGLHDDGVIPGMRAIVDAVHAEGSLAFAHINHAGRASNPKASKQTPIAPSTMACPSTGARAEALSLDAIGELVTAFGDAARRAREAGFDGIELQCGLGYLVAQFMSPRTNLRTDAYGGTPDNRSRFLREVLAAMREHAGQLPIIARISLDEKVPGGQTLADAKDLAELLADEGVVGLHAVMGTACETPPWYYQHMSLPLGVNVKLAAALKESTALVVIVAGRLGGIEEQREAEAAGIDAVGLGRPLVADPDLPNKMLDGRPGEVIGCGACLQGCLANVKAGVGLGCIVNPEVGREAPLIEASTPKMIVVVGGGPAGMQAALTLSARGHQVTLFDSGELGGQALWAPKTPGKSMIARPIDSLRDTVVRSSVELRLGATADVETVVGLEPDVVVVATGAAPRTLSIPGLEDALSGTDLLADPSRAGRRTLVVGGGLIGVEAAELLISLGREVELVELETEIARDMEPVSRKLALKKLADAGVRVTTGARVSSFEGTVAQVEIAGQRRALGDFDAVVVAVGSAPRAALAEPLRAAGLEVHVIGDARAPAQIFQAVQAGYDLGLTL